MVKKVKRKNCGKGSQSNRLKNLSKYNKLKFKLDSDCLLKFRSFEGTCTVPSPVVSEMITALFNRNFNTEMDEILVKKFTVQLLSMLGLIAIFNNDRKVCLDNVFKLKAYLTDTHDKEEEGRYIFSLKTSIKPKYLTSYLYELLFEGELLNNEQEDIEKNTNYIEELFKSFFDGLYKDSSERKEELN